MKPDFTAEQLAQILLRLNGEVQPIGETNADDKRFNDLIRLQETLDILLDEVYFVCEYADYYEFSRKRAGNQAIDWLLEKRAWINDVCAERLKSE